MKILIADDNLFYRCALGATLKEWGYEVVSVSDGEAAWEALREDNAPKLAILDWMMPRMDGPEVCRKVRDLQKPEPPYLLILTAKGGGKEDLVTALESGADDYITKPFDRDELRARLRVGRRIVGLQTSQTVVYAFARAVEAKSPYTQGHSERVTRYALALAGALGLPPAQKEVLRRGGLLHDIGKISVPDAILNKADKLTLAEYEAIKQHPAQGVAIVERLESLHDVIPLIRWHHERPDGRGYPDGLRGDAIPLLVRVLSVADVYDALASARPYRAAMPHAACLETLRADAEQGALDPELVKCFCEIGGIPAASAAPAPPLDRPPEVISSADPAPVAVGPPGRSWWSAVASGGER
jgi:putative two-component system response regulator